MPRLTAVVLLLLGFLSAPAVAAPPSPTPAATALWSAPLPEPLIVTRAFEPTAPYGAGHRGVDLAGAPGAAVLAAGDGVVVFAGTVAGRPVVSVQHPGGLRTTYEPVAPAVGAGQPVSRGQPIGVLQAGHADCPVDACLHWGLRRGDAPVTYLDPLALLRPPRIALLPPA